MTSCATSTRRRVKYPESAVRKAVIRKAFSRHRATTLKYSIHVEAFTVVGFDGKFDGASGCICNQSAHPRQLAEFGPWNRARPESAIMNIGLSCVKHACKGILNLCGGFVPCFYNTFVAHIVRNKAAVVLALLSHQRAFRPNQ